MASGTSKNRHAAVAAAVVALLTLVRLVLAVRLPLGDDEAFYWLWAQHPAACYYDHPGIVAWLVRAGTELLGDTTLGVRLMTILLSAIAAWLIFLLTRWLFGSLAALLAVLIYSLTPEFSLGSFLVASDMPMAVFSLAVLIFVREAVVHERRWMWLAAGASLGLAMASKFTAVLLVPGVLLYLATSRSARRELARPEPYIGAAVAVLFFSPVLFWNANNDWASLAFNAAGRHNAALGSKWLVQLLVSQLLFFSPLIFISLAATLVRLVQLRGAEPRYRLLLWFSVPVLAVFWGASLLTRILPHWPALGYLFLLIACGGLWAGSAGRKASRAWLTASLAVGAVLSALIYIQPIYRILPLKPSDDNTNHLHGWAQVAPAIRQAQQELGGRTAAFLAADRYQFGAQLAWNLKQPYNAFSLNPKRDQFDFWMDRQAVIGRNAVLVWEDDWGINKDVLGAFESNREVAVVPVKRQGVQVRRFHVVACRNLRRLP